jgi:hypothetical protein
MRANGAPRTGAVFYCRGGDDSPPLSPLKNLARLCLDAIGPDLFWYLPEVLTSVLCRFETNQALEHVLAEAAAAQVAANISAEIALIQQPFV